MRLLALFLTLAAPEPPLPGPNDTCGVTLSGQRGELMPDASTPTLRFSVLAKNHLNVPVRAVRVGVLFAADPKAIDSAKVANLYGEKGVPKDVGVVDRLVTVSLPALGEAPLELMIPLSPEHPEPRTFLTHVLGYEVEAANGALLLTLLQTPAAADEFAAVSALSLASDVEARKLARQRWKAQSDIVRAMVDELNKPIPERPNEGDTFRRIYAVRALGVLGGSEASRALETFFKKEELGRFDEPLQVLRIARLGGSPLDAPLAFAIPVTAARMRDVVTVGLEDLRLLDEPLAAPVVPAPTEPVRHLEDAVNSRSEPPNTLVTVVVTATVTFGLVAMGAMLLRRRRGEKL